MPKMTKVVKIYLICNQTDKDGNVVDYKDINKILWDLQYQTRAIKNKIIQLCWEWNGYSSEYYKQNGEYPKDKDVIGYTLAGYIYDKLKIDNDLSSANISSTIQQTTKFFKSSQKDILRGTKSIISYKSDQPLDIHKGSIKLSCDDKEFLIKLTVLNNEGKNKFNFKTNAITFKALVKDNSTKTILERCLSGEYNICGSQLIYDKKKKMWKINLTYQFENTQTISLDKNNILGVDLGVKMPLCASVYGSFDRLTTNGGEIIEFRNRTEARRRNLLRQTKECGAGRIGHGRNTRCKPAYNISDKIAKFRDTKNHTYARLLIDYAIKNGCGTIQMEDLTGATQDKNGFLKNWSYYDLQKKIENKADEVGINVVKINPRYTSQRCSKCGYIHSDNRTTQEKFKCLSCGFEENADYNASQNIAIKDIDKIISEEIKCANPKSA